VITTGELPSHISIEIADTGIGMDDETKNRIFEPFFTTKDVGEGTGLGLSIVFGIIEKHRGSINVVSARGKGTTFTVVLPKNLV
jgi:signal transduction histidine kinase